MNLQPAAAVDRLRMLALMGIEVYLRRVRTAPSPGAATIATASPEPQPTPPEPAPHGRRASIAAAPSRSAATAPLRLVFATGADGGFDDGHGALLRHLALALGLDPAAVDCGPPRDSLPCVCFGAAPGAAIDVLLAPPLATLRASAAARRAFWVSLRSLARRLGS